MEPVFMILAESSVHAAGLAIRNETSVQDVPYDTLREKLLSAGQILGNVKKVSDLQSGE
jgi:hypothetical protein